MPECTSAATPDWPQQPSGSQATAATASHDIALPAAESALASGLSAGHSVHARRRASDVTEVKTFEVDLEAVGRFPGVVDDIEITQEPDRSAP